MKISRALSIIILLFLSTGYLIYSANQKGTVAPKKKLQVSIQPQHLADSIYAVLSGHREVYTKLYATNASTIPDPCSTFRNNSIAVASKGVEFSYVLRGINPITATGIPETEFERKGIESIIKNPEKAFYGEELLGGRWYFTACYADRAFHPACVECHNSKLSEPKRQYKPGDVLGVIIIRVALEL